VLYGVDIQQRAVEICKLRLWISLMVDYPLEVDPHNCALPDFRRALKKITPLPNLDFKIRRADSLIEKIRGQAVKFPQTAADSRDFALSLNKLATAKHRFYEARKKKDKRLAQLDALDATAELAQYEFSAAKLKFGLLPSDKDADRVAELAHAEAEMGKLQMQIAAARKKGERDKDDEIDRLSRVFNDEAKPTFVWQLDFAEIFHRSAGRDALPRVHDLLPEGGAATPPYQHSGFDLVLANPPYVRHEKIKEIKPALQNAYECYTGIADLYVYFYERAIKLLGDGGVISFISSNKFFRAGYGEKLRRFLSERTEIQTVIDFGDLPIFEATAYPCIIVSRNRAPQSADVVRTLNVKSEAELERFTELTQTAAVPLAQINFRDDGWQFESPAGLKLMEKLRRSGKPLREFVGARVSRGLTTGLNEAYVVDQTTRERLIREHKSSAGILKPYMRGKDIDRWYAKFSEQFVIKIESSENKEHPWSHKSKKEAEEIFEKTYPAIYSHFQTLRKKLVNRDDQGRFFWEQRSCKYWAEFEKPKIVSTKISIRPTFALDLENRYLGNTAYFFPSGDSGQFLLGLLNSNVFFAYAKRVFVEKQGGWFEVQPDGLESFPIPAASQEQKNQLAVLVDYAIHLAKAFPPENANSDNARDELMKSYFQQLIDAMVYELFFQDELHPAGRYFFKPLAEEKLPALDEIKGDKTAKLRALFERLFDKDHVLRKNCFFLDTLETVRIIEGKA